MKKTDNGEDSRVVCESNKKMFQLQSLLRKSDKHMFYNCQYYDSE